MQSRNLKIVLASISVFFGITLFLTILYIFLASTELLAQETNFKGSIIVKITNFRSNQGVVKIALFNSKDGFPGKREKALKTANSKITNKQAEIKFDNLNYGIYAIGVFHDENLNDKFDSNWLRIPKEGYGASNDAKGKFGPASFKDASFELMSDTIKIRIKLNY